MRTVLSNRAWRQVGTVTLSVVVAGALAVPAATAGQAPSSQKRSRPAGVASVAPAKGVGTSTGVAVVGTAVKYVRAADGTVRRVR